MRVLIQARTSSQRLPQKVINDFAGKPMIMWTVDRIKQANNVSDIIIVTSSDQTDDALSALAKEKKVSLFRGELDDVAGRFFTYLKDNPCDAFMRISGDSPLIDPELIDRAVDLFQQQNADLTTNIFPRSFPKGQSIEIIKSSVFLQAYPEMRAPEHKEHVTAYFYDNAENFHIENLSHTRQTNHIQLSVDTESDHKKLEELIDILGKDNLNLDRLIKAYESV